MKPSVLFDMYTVKVHRRHQTGGYLFNDGQKPPRVEESTKPICWNFFTTLEKKNLLKKVNFILSYIPLLAHSLGIRFREIQLVYVIIPEPLGEGNY